MILDKKFRADLYYRLNVFPIFIPPLRERPEDIPPLVRHFVRQFARKMNKSIEAISSESMRVLTEYAWPGNVRELQNVIERSVIVCETDVFTVDESWLSRSPAETAPSGVLSRMPAAQEKQAIEAALADSDGRVAGPSGAAARLGIPPSTLDSKIKALGIRKSRFKTA